MAYAIGALSKAAAKIEGASIAGTGLASTAYPTTDATADNEEVLLKSSDQLTLASEGIEETHTFVPENTLDGVPAATGIDNTAIVADGPLEIQGYYDGLDAILACALGFEIPKATISPTAQNSTALTAGTCAAGTWVDSGTPFVAGDVGKFIQVQSDLGEGQVRRISGYNSTSSVDITPNWTVTPSSTDTAVMAQEWLHLFECSNNLEDELYTNVLATYPVGGLGTTSDKIIRRMTLGLLKYSTTPQIHRSVMINTLTIKLDKTKGLTLSVGLMGFNRELSSATNGAASAASWAFDHASPLFVENERIVFPDVSYFRIDAYTNGVLSSADNWGIDEFEITINNNLKGDDQSVTSAPWRVQPGRNAQREITGSFKLPRYSVDTFTDWMTGKTALTMEMLIAGSTIETSARNMSIFVPKLILESVSTPVSGPGIVPMTVGFRAISPGEALAASSPYNDAVLTAPYSELLIETLNQNPFNVQRDQQREY